MSETPSNHREALLAELDLHKTEFSALRDEIIHTTDAEKQALNLSLVAAGAGLSVLSFIDKQSLFSVILLFPFVFHVILWEMLNSIKLLTRISIYLTSVLIPRVNAILDELGSDRKGVQVLGWEVYVNQAAMKPSQLILTSFTPTRHWMPILVVGGLLAAYGVMVNTGNHVPTTIEFVLVGINLVLLIWAAVQNILVLRTYLRVSGPALTGRGAERPKPNLPPRPPANRKK